MLLADNAAVSPTRAPEDRLEVTTRQSLETQSHHQTRLGLRPPLIAGHDLGLEPGRADFLRYIAHARQADLDRAHTNADRALGQVPVAIAALFSHPLIAATTKKIVNFLFERGLQHLASSLAHDHFEHIVWRRDGCGWRQNLIRFRHGVTLPEIDLGDQVRCEHRKVTPLPSPAWVSLAGNFHKIRH
jgi:hypothetical protein